MMATEPLKRIDPPGPERGAEVVQGMMAAGPLKLGDKLVLVMCHFELH